MDGGSEWNQQMWMGCEPCWRGGVYTYVEQRMAKQTAADEVPERAAGQAQPPQLHFMTLASESGDFDPLWKYVSFLDNGKTYFL
jgi:hypothetical protein